MAVVGCDITSAGIDVGLEMYPYCSFEYDEDKVF